MCLAPSSQLLLVKLCKKNYYAVLLASNTCPSDAHAMRESTTFANVK